jgi:hypothetical protein
MVQIVASVSILPVAVAAQDGLAVLQVAKLD